MSGDDGEFNTEEVFKSAVSIVQNLPPEGSFKPSDELKLKLYAYFKQATHGPNDTPKPRFYQIVQVYKWDAWRRLDQMSKEDAMLNYIRELRDVMETIQADEFESTSHERFEDVLGRKFYDYCKSLKKHAD